MKKVYRDRYLSKKDFKKRFLETALLAFGIFFVSILIGILGYHYIVGLEWIDAFLNASMILGGMGQITELHGNGEKIFAACYALFSGVTFLSSMAIFLSPLIHRLLRRFHLEFKGDDDIIE